MTLDMNKQHKKFAVRMKHPAFNSKESILVIHCLKNIGEPVVHYAFAKVQQSGYFENL